MGREYAETPAFLRDQDIVERVVLHFKTYGYPVGAEASASYAMMHALAEGILKKVKRA
jgi:hypothetical protein